MGVFDPHSSSRDPELWLVCVCVWVVTHSNNPVFIFGVALFVTWDSKVSWDRVLRNFY